jgi:hypothetical protein
MCGIQCTVSVSSAFDAATACLLSPNIARRGPDAQKIVQIRIPSCESDTLSQGGMVTLAGSVLRLRGVGAGAQAVQTDEHGNALCYNGTCGGLFTHASLLFFLALCSCFVCTCGFALFHFTAPSKSERQPHHHDFHMLKVPCRGNICWDRPEQWR